MEAIADPAARDARFSELVQWYYDSGKASNLATYYEVDDVIDPADTRRWLVRGLKAPLAIDTEADSRPHVGRFVDPW
jgi:acetyl-CoA carboxylase carboxyltransferase component